MTAARDKLKTIVGEALEIASAQERAAYLAQACAMDVDLRSQVDELLESLQRASGGMHESASGTEVTVEMASQVELPTTIGPYKLLQQIGEGGMGVVHMAEQTEPVRRRVALKVIKLGMDTRSVLARFEAERQALAMMDHPNIAKVLDAGTTVTGRPYFVMELVNGLPITDYCDEQHLTTTQRLRLFTKVCNAVQHAHQKGIIHRDLKPSNVLVAEYDHEAVPKVIDFGVAKATNQSLTEKTLFTQLGQIVGTMEYMSPEQAQRNQLDIDTRSDIYSLGVVLYELLTGETPFDKRRLRSAAMDELLRIIREEDPPKPSTRLSKSETLSTIAAKRKVEPTRLAAFVRGELDWIVMKTLEKDRARRYQTATALAADIENFFADQPVLACPPSSVYRLRKFVRRNRASMVTAGLVLASLLIGLATTTRQTIVAERARTSAESHLIDAQRERKRAEERTAEAEAARHEEAMVRLSLERRVYCSTMQRVQNSWQARAFLSKQLLDSLTPNLTGGTDLRNFEWHYWYRGVLKPKQVLQGHVGIVHDVAYGPEGRHLATAGFDRSIRIWRLDTGSEVNSLEGHQAPVTTVSFSPDGERLASAGYDRLIKVWDWREPRELVTFSGHQQAVHAVAFSRDGQTLASASYDGSVCLWDVQSGQRRHTLRGNVGEAWGIDFSPDDRLVASGHESSTVALWDVEDGELTATLEGHSDGVTGVKFSSDGTRLATASHDHEARVWDVASGESVVTLQGHGNWVQSIAWSDDDRSLLTASWDGTSRVWNADTGEELFSLRGHTAYVQSAEFSPDARSIASVGNDGTVRLWNGHSPRSSSKIHIPDSIAGQTNYPTFSADGEVLFVPSYTGSLRGWDVHTGDLVWEQDGGMGSATSSDGRVATGDQQGNVYIYDVATGDERLRFLAEPGGFHFLAFNADGSLLVTNGTPWGRDSPTTVKVWDAHTGESVAALRDETEWVSMVAFSPDGDRMATSSYDDTIKIWNTSNWKLEQTLLGHADNVDAVAFSPSGEFVVSGAYDATARIWDLRSGRAIHELRGHASNVLRVAYTPDGQRVASGSLDGEVKVWDVATGQEVLSLPCGRVSGLAFSPDGNRLVSTGFDGIHIWNATPRE